MPAAAKISRLKKIDEIACVREKKFFWPPERHGDQRQYRSGFYYLPSLLRAEVHLLATGFEEAETEGMGQVIAGIRSGINGKACG